jgi:phosphoserine aminotransferase
VEDYLDSLQWAASIGGVKTLTARANANLAVISQFVADNEWIKFLAVDPASRSNTSVCLSLDLSKDRIKALTTLLEKEKVAYDIGSYRDAPPGLRIWAGATVEAEDTAALMQWLRWAYHVVSA